jgi:hypothetical protein
MPRPAPALATLLPAALAATAGAQTTSDSAVTYSLSWSEGPGGNGDNLIELGETVLFRLTVSFTNQNTIATFTPPQGGFNSGTIRGLASAFIDLNGPGFASQGTWDVAHSHGYGVVSAWDLLNGAGNGVPTSGGSSLTQIQFGQFPPSSAAINATNPVVSVYSALWTPAHYGIQAFVPFQIAADPIAGAQASAVELALTNGLAFPAYCPSNFGSVNVHFDIPSPPALACLIVAAPIAARRRRKAICTGR